MPARAITPLLRKVVCVPVFESAILRPSVSLPQAHFRGTVVPARVEAEGGKPHNSRHWNTAAGDSCGETEPILAALGELPLLLRHLVAAEFIEPRRDETASSFEPAAFRAEVNPRRCF